MIADPENAVGSSVLDIQSSKETFETETDEIADHPQRRVPRFLFFTVRTTVTSTLTSYSIAGTVVTRTITLGNAGQLLCLPSGYIVC